MEFWRGAGEEGEEKVERKKAGRKKLTDIHIDIDIIPPGPPRPIKLGNLDQ